MPVRPPTEDQLLEIAASFGMNLTRENAASFRRLMAGSIASYNRLDQLPEPMLPVKFPRTPGYRPGPEENRLNTWYWKSEIKGAPEGVLAGKKVAVKDNICVAGVPMMNGSRWLEGYVPDVDATVVTRVLENGGTVAGKAACEDLCFSAGSHTCTTPDPFAIPTTRISARAVLRVAAPRWLLRGKWRWHWVATRADRFELLPHGAASAD